MTEQEWLVSEDPRKMLEFLRDKPSERKLRLFAVACCRRIWHLLPEAVCRDAILIGERYADAAASASELFAARTSLVPLESAMPGEDNAALNAVAWLTDHWQVMRLTPVRCVAAGVQSAIEPPSARGSSRGGAAPGGAVEAEAATQAALLRDIIGNPFRPVPVDRDQLAWRTATVTALATGADMERELPSGHLDLARLAILSDALEEAGCTDEGVLSHLRSPGPHVRGCFAVDLILARA
jgi:hypothetical protein